MPEGSAVRRVGPWLWRRAWALAAVVLGGVVAACWVGPLVHRQGSYLGHYRYFDIELGLAETIVWVSVTAVACAPARVRRRRALLQTVAVTALLTTAAVCDLACVFWSVHGAHFWHHQTSFAKSACVPDPELIWKHRPYLSWSGRKTADCQFIRFRTDENGFRNPPGMRRADLVFLGDSVTEAGEVVEDATFVRKTAELTGLSAVNLGVFRYGPQQELAVLKRYGLAYRPRAVVWQVTEWNDLGDAEQYLTRADPDSNRLPPWRDQYEQHSPLVQFLGTVFPGRHKYLVDFALSDGRRDRRAIWPHHDPVASDHGGLAETERAIGEARALCRERGIAFAVLLVPSHLRVLSPYLRPRTPIEHARYEPPGGLDRPGDLSHALAESCRARDCPLIDLAPPLRRRAALDNRHVYVRNDAHLDVDGHDEAARALARWLCSPEALALKTSGDTVKR